MIFSNRCRLAIWFALPVFVFPPIANGQDGAPVLPSVTVQIPTLGVSIDADGVMAGRNFSDPNGQLNLQRLAALQKPLPKQVRIGNTYRKVSLRRLETAISQQIANGQAPSDTIRALAGLTRIEYIFVLPEENDIVVAGPAEPWIRNLAGRFVGLKSGKPIVLLEDLLTALRLFNPDRKQSPWIACSIDPTVTGLERLRDFQSELPNNVPASMRLVAAKQLTDRLRSSLGTSDVNVYGIDPRTHAAHVMIEADYRMKAIAIGLEAATPNVRTFVQLLKGAPQHFQRWWLTPDYQCLNQSDDGLAVRIDGQGVNLRTETITFNKQAVIQKTNIKPSRAARIYASSFTEHYRELAQQKPVFAQLRNVIDCFLLAAWLKHEGAYRKTDWQPTLLLDPNRLSVADRREIKKAHCLANGLWKNNVLLLPSGGVSIQPNEALKSGNLTTESDKKLNFKRKEVNLNSDNWWWD